MLATAAAAGSTPARSKPNPTALGTDSCLVSHSGLREGTEQPVSQSSQRTWPLLLGQTAGSFHRGHRAACWFGTFRVMCWGPAGQLQYTGSTSVSSTHWPDATEGTEPRLVAQVRGCCAGPSSTAAVHWQAVHRQNIRQQFALGQQINSMVVVCCVSSTHRCLQTQE